MSKKYETATHYNMAMFGGFMAGFSVWNFFDMLGNAQTANMISIVCSITGGNFFEVLLRVIGLAVYFLGFAVSVIIVRYTKLNPKLLSIAFDACAIAVIALLPENLNKLFYLYPMFFAMSYQWTAFSGANGFVSSTIFSTNNLRQFSTSLVESICDKEKSKLKKTKFYGFTLLYFHIGVAIACVSSLLFGKFGAFTGIAPLIPATAMVLKQSQKVKSNKESVSTTPLKKDTAKTQC